MRGSWKRGAILLLALFLTGSLAGESAVELNTGGFHLYRQNRYAEALKLFKRATELDPGYALAHYNVACTLGVLHKQGKTCEFGAYRSVIIRYLRRSVELDPGRRKRMLTDSDLEPVHDTFAYQTLAGLNPRKEADVRLILQRVSWYGPSPGTLGPLSRIAFHEDGTLLHTSRSLDADGFHKKETRGRYSIRGAHITLTLQEAPGRSLVLEGELKANGELLFSEASSERWRHFTDDPDDCNV